MTLGSPLYCCCCPDDQLPPPPPGEFSPPLKEDRLGSCRDMADKTDLLPAAAAAAEEDDPADVLVGLEALGIVGPRVVAMGGVHI